MTDYFHLDIPENNIRSLSNLGLAHLGDAVFELMVRSWLCIHGKLTPKGLHSAAVSLVSAPSQAAAAVRLRPFLTEEELKIYTRGRNTRVRSIPRGATVGQYHAATGLETLFGHLYLQGRTARLNELFDQIMAEHPHWRDGDTEKNECLTTD